MRAFVEQWQRLPAYMPPMVRPTCVEVKLRFSCIVFHYGRTWLSMYSTDTDAPTIHYPRSDIISYGRARNYFVHETSGK